MRFLRRHSFLGSALLAVLLVASAGLYLANSQASAARKLHHDYAARAGHSAQLIGSIIRSSLTQNLAYIRPEFSGAESTVQGLVDRDQTLTPSAETVVLSGDGRVLGSYPHGQARDAGAIVRRPEIALARKGTPGLSDVVTYTSGAIRGPAVMLTVVFTVAGKQRVWSSAAPIDQISGVATAYLGAANTIRGGRAYLIDGKGVLVSGPGKPGSRFADRALVDAAGRATSGTIAGRAWASAPVAGTHWRVVFSTPTRTLLTPVTATRRAAWLLFGGIVLAIVSMLVLAAFALRSSHRLAFARLHDGLTGLPNRKVFLDRTERAMAEIHLHGGQLAVLFLDLDRFKPVNDMYGHAAGDGLLVAVTTRLREAVRSGDLVSRFGGDEFLVLCSALIDRAQAYDVAERIEQAVSAPFELDGHVLSISTSIGIAYHSGDDALIDANSLVNHADLAMYEAKRLGRARIETAEPPAPVLAGS